MIELKPCPFCGSKAQIGHVKRKKIFSRFSFPYCTHFPYVTCNACKCRTEVKYTIEEAIEAWNRRVSE